VVLVFSLRNMRIPPLAGMRVPRYQENLVIARWKNLS
jgi:hypothetical protein